MTLKHYTMYRLLVDLYDKSIFTNKKEPTLFYFPSSFSPSVPMFLFSSLFFLSCIKKKKSSSCLIISILWDVAIQRETYLQFDFQVFVFFLTFSCRWSSPTLHSAALLVSKEQPHRNENRDPIQSPGSRTGAPSCSSGPFFTNGHYPDKASFHRLFHNPAVGNNISTLPGMMSLLCFWYWRILLRILCSRPFISLRPMDTMRKFSPTLLIYNYKAEKAWMQKSQ